MKVKHPGIGICGVSCRLCPIHHSRDESICAGCKDEYRSNSACPLIACAATRDYIEFCWECPDGDGCELWQKALSEGCNAIVKHHRVEENICFIRQNGIDAFESIQRTREKLLNEMLDAYDEGRFIDDYCIAATLLEIGELEAALTQAWIDSPGMRIESKAEILHSILDSIRRSKVHFV